MAFFSKARGILQQTVTRHVNKEIAALTPSIFQVIRCVSSKVFVGGISYQMDENSFRDSFSKYGEVVEARIIVDRDSGRSRGFGFVTYATPEQAAAAIQAMDQRDLFGRSVRVSYANDRARGGGSGGFGNYGGGYNSGGYNSGGYGGDGGNYNNNFGSNTYGGGSSGGYGGDSYGSGGVDNSGTGGNYASSGGNYASGSNYTTGYGSSGNYSSGNSYDGNQGLSYGGGDQFANDGSSNIAGDDGSYKLDNPSSEADFQDDNEPQDYADRKVV